MFFYCYVAFLLLAPLYKAGNRPIPLMLLEATAIGLLFVVLAVHRAPLQLPRTMLWAIGLLLAYPLVQLVPLPEALWRRLPGHELYAEVFDRYAGGVGGWRPASVIPSATEYGWLALLPPLACLLGAMRLSVDQVVKLLLAMVVFAAAQSLLGLLQIAPGGGGALYLGNEELGLNAAIGTFVNRNHFAAMLAMTLPVIVGLFVYSLRPGLRRRRKPESQPRSEAHAKRALLFACAVMVLLCLAFTRSRAGIVAAFIGLACSAVVLVRARAAIMGDTSTRAASYVVAGMVAVALVLALAIGIEPIVRAMAPGALLSSADFRGAIYIATVRGAVAFMPFGSGLSTYAGIFPRFQLADAGGYIDYAHNDYLQAFMELGVVGVAVTGLLLYAYAGRMWELARAKGGRSFTLLQLAAGAAMVPMMLHSLFDFALHMPATAMWFATLCGVMFHRMIDPKDPFQGERPKLMLGETVLAVPLPLGAPAAADFRETAAPALDVGQRVPATKERIPR